MFAFCACIWSNVDIIQIWLVASVATMFVMDVAQGGLELATSFGESSRPLGNTEKPLVHHPSPSGCHQAQSYWGISVSWSWCTGRKREQDRNLWLRGSQGPGNVGTLRLDDPQLVKTSEKKWVWGPIAIVFDKTGGGQAQQIPPGAILYLWSWW